MGNVVRVFVCLVIILFGIGLFLPKTTAASKEIEQQIFNTANDEILDLMPNSYSSLVSNQDENKAEQNIVLNLKQVLFTTLNDVTQNLSSPIRLVSSIVGILVLSIAISSFEGKTVSSNIVGFVYSLSVATIVIANINGFFDVVKSTIEASDRFCTEFLAVYSGVLVSAGAVSTTAVFGGILITCSKVFSSVTVGILSPINGVLLGISVSKGSDEIGITKLVDTAKNFIIFAITICTAVVIAVAKLQVSISSAVDTASIKAGKYIVGTAIPIVGTSVSGAMGTVSSGFVTAKNGVGITGITIITSIFLPVIIQGVVLVIALKICEGFAYAISNRPVETTLGCLRSCIEINIALVVAYFLIVVFSISSVVSFYS